jgi:YVTN family beta-propeller protein
MREFAALLGALVLVLAVSARTVAAPFAYVSNFGDNRVSVIATASNKVVATVPVGGSPPGVAVTPDGNHVYVTTEKLGEFTPGAVSVIDTATNTVVAKVPVGATPIGVGIIPTPVGVPFSAFKAKLEIVFSKKPNEDVFVLRSNFTLGSASSGIHSEEVTLKACTFTVTIPPGSFKGPGFGPFTFTGVIHGSALAVAIEPIATKRYALEAAALDVNLKGTKNPVPVTLTIGDDSGTTSVKADIDRDRD